MRLVTAGVRMAPERAAFDADTRPRRDVSGPELAKLREASGYAVMAWGLSARFRQAAIRFW